MTTPDFAVGTVRTATGVHAVLLSAGRVLDLDAVADQLGLVAPLATRELLATWDRVLPVLRRLGDATDAAWQPLADVEVLAPVEPRQVIQAGANYRTHVLDLAVRHADPADGRSPEQVRSDAAAMMDRRAAEGEPYFFLGLPTCIGGPYDDVVLPAGSSQHDWELELAVVIGRPGYRISPADAAGHVAAYTIVNDLTTRDLVFRKDMPEIGTDWFRAKCSPGFLPLGPWLVPADLVEADGLRLTLELNGDVMQDESTKDMIFDVAALVSAASRTVPLLPGDLVLTGSPAGNGLHWGRLLRDGDVMQASITGLGTQRTRCVAEQQ